LRRWLRVYLIALGLSIFITGLGASTRLSKVEASNIIENFRAQLPEKLSATAIFRNNFQVALIMLIPVAGWIIGGYALYNTGVIISATATRLEVPGGLVLLALFTLPFAPLEFGAYSAALTQSYFIAAGIYRRKIRPQIREVGLVVLIIVALLLLAAYIEVSYL
jgi:uncharacterized membrane protein SpoIIM required for sporulation